MTTRQITAHENAALAPHTTLKIGGPARCLFRVTTRAELTDALAFAGRHALPYFVLGGGSNLLVDDLGFAGVVIKMELPGVAFERLADEIRVTAAAGEAWDELVARTVNAGAWGLENLSLIPGTVGAAPVQNIGAYGVEVKDCLESVRVLDAASGLERVLTNAECRFAYRDSVFKHEAGRSAIILAVTFRLSATPRPNLAYKDLQQVFGPGTAPTQAQIREAVIAIRTAKFPDLAQVGTAGSFWKNPVIPAAAFRRLATAHPGVAAYPAGADKVKVSLAWILDKVCGLRGHSRGHVGLFEKQPLILVAHPGATAAEVRAFEGDIRARVRAATGIEIEPEVGFMPPGQAK